MTHFKRAACTLAVVVAAGVFSEAASGGQRDGSAPQDVRDNDKKPSVSLKATPPVGFSPLKVHAVAELRGGADDHPDFYCAAVEWEWGDGTVSENAEDCDPYVAGKSTIRRRYSADHTYRIGDAYKVFFKLKQKNRVVGSGQANVQVRAGAREGFGE
jgi:hypothetical protein